MFDSDDERRAFESVQAGDPDPKAIYLAYAGVMRETASSKLLDVAALGLDAEDVVDEVMEGIIDRTITVPPSAAPKLRAYLRAVARNKASDQIGRAKAEVRALGRKHPVDSTTFEEDIETMVLAEQFGKRMHLLTNRERYVIVERVMKRRRSKDVAAELGIDPQQISQIQDRAVAKLAANLPFSATSSSDQSEPAETPDETDREEGTP